VNVVRFLVGRSLRQHALSTVVTVSTVSIGIALTLAIVALERNAATAFQQGAGGFDGVLGPRGSQTQIVLNALYHLEASPGNISWNLYQAIAKRDDVEATVPIALGDNYHGFRIVGTTDAMLNETRLARGASPQVMPPGRWFDATKNEVVVGAEAARRTHLRLGDTVHPYHGLVFEEGAQHAEQYTVVGIIAPTNTPMDRALFIPLDGLFRMGGHVLRGTGKTEYEPQVGVEIPDEHKEVSAVLVRLKSPTGGFALDHLVNRQGKVATFAYPVARVVAELFDKLGWVAQVLALVAALVVAMALITTATCLYNTMESRRRDIALLRALGASRGLVTRTVMAESAAIAGLGALVGIALHAGIVALAAGVVWDRTGVLLTTRWDHWAIWALPLVVTVLGGLAGLLPAWRAYRVDVVEALAPTS